MHIPGSLFKPDFHVRDPENVGGRTLRLFVSLLNVATLRKLFVVVVYHYYVS